MKWLYDNWMKSTPFLALYILLMLVMYVMNQYFALFLIWLQTPVYLLHEFEEYICPGGFLSFFNKKPMGSQTGDAPLNKVGSFWINIPLVFVAFPLSAILSQNFDLSIGIWAAYFSIINGLAHIVWFFVYKFKYNPGMVVSLLLNVPVGTYTVYYFAANSLISAKAQIAGFVVALAVQLAMAMYGFLYLKPRIKK